MTTSWDCFAQYQKHSTCVCQYLNITCDILGFILLLLNLKHRKSLLIIKFMVGHEPVQLAFKARMRDKRIVLCRYSCRCNEEEEYLLATLDTNNSTSPSEVQELDRDLYLGVYAVFVICLLFFTLLRTQLFFKLTIVASRKLHLRMFSALLRAPSYFFDTNSIG